MKPLMNIEKKMSDNAGSDVFKNAFFDRFTLKKAPQPLKLKPGISRDYLFPTLQADVTCAVAIFLCSYAKAEELVASGLHEKVKPVKMTGGRSAIVFSCYEYKNVMNMRPYNEMAMLIPVMVNTGFSPPLLPMIMKFRHAGFFVAGMPVTSYENQLRGNLIWGMPKVTQRVDITRERGSCFITAHENNGEPFVSLRVPVYGTKTEFDETSKVYTRLNGKLLRCTVGFTGTFNVNKHMGILLKKNVKPEEKFLETGPGPSAGFMRELEIGEHPLQTRYAEHVSTFIDLPDRDTESWFSRLNQ